MRVRVSTVLSKESQGKDRTKHPPLLKSWLWSLGWCLFSGQASPLVIRLQMCAWALAAHGKLPVPTHSPWCWDIQASHTQMCTCVLCQWVLLVLLTLSAFLLRLGSQATHVSSSLICFWFSDVSTCCAVAYSEMILISMIAGSLLNLLYLFMASMKFLLLP